MALRSTTAADALVNEGGTRRSILELAPLELECMNTLWPLGEASVREIQTGLAPTLPRAYTTIMTIMDRLAQKGIVERRKAGRAYVYRPSLSADQARAHAVAQIVHGFFEGSADALAAHLSSRVVAAPAVVTTRTPRVARRVAASAEGAGKANAEPAAAPPAESGRDLAVNTRCFRTRVTIRNIEISPATVLAPMAGITDTVFRRVIRGLGGCGLIMTEFTSAEGLTRNEGRTLRYLLFEPDEHPITAQLFGANPEAMARAAASVEELGFDIVDINLGCPAKKVVKCGGSGLLRDLNLLEKILSAVRAAVRIPLTIKMRGGWDEQSIVAVEVAKMAEQIGIEAIAVHPRTRLAGICGPRELGDHRRSEARGACSGHRQRRHSRSRRCCANGCGNGLRRRDDRPRGRDESLDFPADRGVCRRGNVRRSFGIGSVRAALRVFSRVCWRRAGPMQSAR